MLVLLRDWDSVRGIYAVQPGGLSPCIIDGLLGIPSVHGLVLTHIESNLGTSPRAPSVCPYAKPDTHSMVRASGLHCRNIGGALTSSTYSVGPLRQTSSLDPTNGRPGPLDLGWAVFFGSNQN